MILAGPSELAEFRRLADLYAYAVDQRHPGIFETIVTDDIAIIGPSFQAYGLDTVRGIPEMLTRRYLATRHALHNLLAWVDGDRASGALTCTADHVWRNASGGIEQVRWYLRYDDAFVRTEAGWRFKARRIIVDWTDERSVAWAAGTGEPLSRLPANDDPGRAARSAPAAPVSQ